MLAYTVIATLPDEATRSEYIEWLRSGHLRAVIEGGASSAEIVRVDDPASPPQVETRYVFPSRAVFDDYVRDTGPRLRAEGLERFGSARGVTFSRRIGTLL